MATQEDVQHLVGELVARDPEGFYNDNVDTYDVEGAEALVEALAVYTDEMRGILAQAAAVRQQAFAGRGFPVSFVDFVAAFGFSDIVDHDHAVNLWLQSLAWNMGMDAAQYASFTGSFAHSVVLRGQPAVAFEFVDNPGDMPGYGFVALLEESTGEGENLWLYRGWDLAWEDGSLLAPMGRTFWDVAYLALSGLADALYVPNNEFPATLGRLIGDPEALIAQLDDMAALCTRFQDLQVAIDDAYAETPLVWADQLAHIDARIVAIRDHLRG